MTIFKFDQWQPVRKVSGYPFPGIIVARFVTQARHIRYVVECTALGVEGCLHIFSEDQLELRL